MRLRWSVVRAAVAAAVAGALLAGAAPAGAAAPPPLAAAADTGRVGAYVQAVYQDLFGRDPDPTGAATWTRALLSGAPRVGVANAITASREFRSGLIGDAYDHYLGRQPDAAGLQTWLGVMERGVTISQMESGFIASDEYWARAGATPAGWVAALYGDVLGRAPGPAEVRHWVEVIAGGGTREQVAMGFLLSTEHLRTIVNGYYQWLLGRDIDPSGQQTWVTILQGGGRDEAIIGGIVASDEYWGLATAVADVTSIEVLVPDGPVPAGLEVEVAALGLGADGRVLVDLTDVAAFVVDGVPGTCGQGWCDLSTRAGTHTVTATWGSLRASADVTVVAGGLVDISAWTSSVALRAGEAFEVHVWGVDDAGNSAPVIPDSVEPDAGGSCAGSVCTFTSTGGHHLTIAAGDLTTSLFVTVSAGPPAHIRLEPATATVTSGAGQVYDVWWTDAYGNGVQPGAPLTIAVDGVPCANGVCAPSALGAHTVVATAGSLSGSASLSVVAPGPTASRLFGWGDENYVGTGASTSLTSPLLQVGLDTHWVSIAAGANHTLGITSDGALWGWGDGSWGQLGDGNRNGSAAPRRIGTARWIAVAASGQQSVGIQADGSLWAWGSGKLESYDDSILVPTRVGNRTDWTAVAASGETGFALAADGALWAWGANTRGELGDGSGVDSATPVLVGGGRHWRAVAARDGHVLAIAADGSLWGWGVNTCGQVGDGTTVTRVLPTQIGTATSWATVSAGECTSVATRTDHTLWSWGDNQDGQLGLGDRVARSVPTRVGTGTTWAAAFAGRAAMHAVTSDGQLWGWGTGWLGLAKANGADTGDSLFPVRIGTDAGWAAVTEGDYWVAALRP